MYLYRDLRIELDDDLNKILSKLAKKLSINKEDIYFIDFYKKSIDARNKNDIFFVYSILFDSDLNINNPKISIVDYEKVYPKIGFDNLSLKSRPVVVGFGPSGMFCALNLARKNLNPIVIEQGKSVENRIKDVNDLLYKGIINPKSNICFGEGGAGTFSDGKLNSGNSDPLSRMVLNEFVNHGAPKEILYEGKPHIGTNKLRDVVKNIREEIISLGGTVLFETTFKSLILTNKQITGVIIENNGIKKRINTNYVFLGIGHSSFETYKYLYENQIELAKKDFAIGFRIQHSQEFINKSQYGRFANNPNLPAASYKLVTHLENGRTVFSFCNCPGGIIVNSSTNANEICVNGMSDFERNSPYSNSAILVNIKTSDIEGENPLNGILFQRQIENKAYKKANEMAIPIQDTNSFLNNQIRFNFDDSVTQGVKGVFCDLSGILPIEIEQSLKQGLTAFDKKITDFTKDSYLFGVETRSSSPIRILRNPNYQSVSLNNLFVYGEGAGTAGGIMTSAIDGYNASMSFINSIKGESDEK